MSMMYGGHWGGYGYGWDMNPPAWLPLFGLGIVIVVLWSVFWKGLALWHSAQRGQYWWFLIMMIANTAGILEIIYLFGIAKLKFDQLFTSRHHH